MRPGKKVNKFRRNNHNPNYIGMPLKDGDNGHFRLDRALIYRIILGALLILGITFLYPIERIYLPIDIPGLAEVAPDDIIAQFDYPIYKNPEELERARQIILAYLKPVLRIDTTLSDSIKTHVSEFFDLLDSLQLSTASLNVKISILKAEYPSLPDSILPLILSKKNNALVKNIAQAVLDSLLSDGIVNDLSAVPLQGSGLVIIVKNGLAKTVTRESISDSTKLGTLISDISLIRAGKKTDFANAADIIVSQFIRPNLFFDKEKTEQNRKEELAAIPLTKGMVFKGEKIINAGERVTEFHRDKLVSLAKFRNQIHPARGLWEYLLPPLGRLFFVAFPIIFFFFFLFFFKNRIYSTNSDLLLFAILIVGEVVLFYIVMSQGFLSKYLAPLAIASMVTTILYDEEVGLAITISLAMLAGVLAGFKLDIAFVTLIAGMVGCFSVHKVRHRHDFYRPILYLCLTYGGSVYLIESLKLTPIIQLWSHVALAITNGFISPILTIGLLPLFESAFGITTDITLLELSDLNRPLLKRLALEAPGTYHHSIMIGTLAEDAAESIRANSLLARVGSYYHDIGKVLKPEYFVENQLDADNKHEKLAPTMSAIILESHVKEGIELAVRNGLPKSIIEFITGHHGYGIMSYFFDKAKKEGDINADIDEFRYPGPNPRSKEVAIVMLADSVEAASRTLDDPKPARIRSLVHRITMDKLDSGLLENSDLTLRDIKKIEESFVRVLTAFFHRRIKYPENKEAPV
jgi:hypothetical protein